MQKTITLKNGLKFLYIQEKNIDACALGFSVNAGVYFEDKEKSGIAHLTEHLIGVSQVDGKAFRENIYETGGLLEASTSLFNTYFYLTCLPKDFVRLTETFIKGIFNPNFSRDRLRDSKESIVSELAYLSDIEPYSVLRSMIWKDTNLSKPIVGYKSSVLELEIDDITNFHDKYYTPENVSVVLIAPELTDSIVNLLEGIQGVKGVEDIKVDLSINLPSFKLLQERNMKTAIAISFPTKGFKGIGEGRHYFNLAAGALTEVYISRLASSGLIYDESWVWNVFPNSGDFILYLDNVDHSHLLNTLKEVVEIVDNWTQKPFNQSQFDTLKKHKILDLKTHTSLSEKIVLLTKNFSSSEEVHTYEEAIKVYEKADLKTTLDSFNKILLSDKPFIVVSAGVDSLEEVGKIEVFLENYYSAS